MKSEIQKSRLEPKRQPNHGDLDNIKLVEAEFEKLRLGGKFDEKKLLDLFAFDVDEQGKSKLVKMLEMISRLRSLAVAPGGLAFLRLQLGLVTGRIQSQYRPHVSNLTGALFTIVGRASEGDEKAQQQLQALNRIAFPAQFDFDDEMIKKVAGRQPKAINYLRLGCEVLVIMDRISGVVEPKLSGQFLSPATYIIRKKKREPFDLQICGGDLLQKVDGHTFKPTTTLRSLAVSIYLKANSKVKDSDVRKGIRLEAARQSKLRQGPVWSLSISTSPTKWVPFCLSFVPLKSARAQTAKNTANNSQL